MIAVYRKRGEMHTSGVWFPKTWITPRRCPSVSLDYKEHWGKLHAKIDSYYIGCRCWGCTDGGGDRGGFCGKCPGAAPCQTQLPSTSPLQGTAGPLSNDCWTSAKADYGGLKMPVRQREKQLCRCQGQERRMEKCAPGTGIKFPAAHGGSTLEKAFFLKDCSSWRFHTGAGKYMRRRYR